MVAITIPRIRQYSKVVLARLSFQSFHIGLPLKKRWAAPLPDTARVLAGRRSRRLGSDDLRTNRRELGRYVVEKSRPARQQGNRRQRRNHGILNRRDAPLITVKPHRQTASGARVGQNPILHGRNLS